MTKQSIKLFTIFTCVIVLYFGIYATTPRQPESVTSQRVLSSQVVITDTEEQKALRAAVSGVTGEVEPMVFTASAYCSCEVCCGEWANNRPDGIVYTASGAEAVVGITIAVDPQQIPYGTKVYIEGVGIRIAQDCGGAIDAFEIDIYCEDHNSALEFGKQELKVWILEENNNEKN